jgi:hypothetical protein
MQCWNTPSQASESAVAKLGLPNIVNYHVPDLFASVVLGQKILGERRCGDFGEVFVLGNGEHLLFGQAAESDAVFQRNHDLSIP